MVRMQLSVATTEAENRTTVRSIYSTPGVYTLLGYKSAYSRYTFIPFILWQYLQHRSCGTNPYMYQQMTQKLNFTRLQETKCMDYDPQ